MQDNFKRNRLLIVFSNPWHKLNLWSLTQTPRGRFIHCAAEITRGSWEKQKKKNPCWKSENDSSRPGDTYSWYVIRTFVLLVLCINWKTDDLPHYSLCFQLLNCQELSVLPRHHKNVSCSSDKYPLPAQTWFWQKGLLVLDEPKELWGPCNKPDGKWKYI